MKKIDIFAIGIIVLLLCFYIGYYFGNKSDVDIEQLQTQIVKLEEEKQLLKKNADRLESEAIISENKAKETAKKTEQIKAELEEEKTKVHVEYINGVEYLPASISEKQDGLILSLETQLGDTQKALDLTKSALSDTKKALEKSELQRNLDHIAAEASKSAIKNARWQGRFEGAGVMEGVNLLAKLLK